MKIQIAPSILSADFGKLNVDIKTVSSADILHIDVMDAHFVNNLTLGPVIVKDIKTKLTKHAHLMVEHPLDYIKQFADIGCKMISVHIECSQAKSSLKLIKSLKVKPGLAINPDTDLKFLKPYIKNLDHIIIMSVNPGFGGQEFIMASLEKVAELRKAYPKLNIAVDGGVNKKTAKLVKEAGANILVTGSYLFKKKNRKKAIKELRNS